MYKMTSSVNVWLCVCLCVCVRACVRACVCVTVLECAHRTGRASLFEEVGSVQED